ncbi:hypothetical protein B9Z55_003207 [Caenorhabditis nigoni]|uniref:SXP/RAL-2 family protein Ani s 5-like cation-binding domain-containing protein n=1 Tax=Caenorhabditis nigoni TaxID=1611254 RepID=A0A2G5VNZ6_9PELO|nr:hypothetical protein B9Z55_003207 [Caenorhabditis nigoni]
MKLSILFLLAIVGFGAAQLLGGLLEDVVNGVSVEGLKDWLRSKSIIEYNFQANEETREALAELQKQLKHVVFDSDKQAIVNEIIETLQKTTGTEDIQVIQNLKKQLEATLGLSN